MAKQKRQKYSKAEILGPFFDMPEDYNDLVSVYRTLAKSADQRLVRLERYSEQDQFHTATKWAYARAQRDIKEWSGEGATRFNTKPPASVSDLKAKIQDIKTFLQSPTSTKRGIKEVYGKKADTLNKKYGTNFKWDEVGKFFQSKLYQKMDKMYGSKTIVKIIGKIQSNKKDVIKAINEAKDKDITIDTKSNKMLDRLVNKTLNKYGKEVKALLE